MPVICGYDIKDPSEEEIKNGTRDFSAMTGVNEWTGEAALIIRVKGQPTTMLVMGIVELKSMIKQLQAVLPRMKEIIDGDDTLPSPKL